MGDSRTTGLATLSFQLRNAAGRFTGRTYGSYMSTLTPGGENGIRFNSNSFGGFSVTASAHGDDKWGVGANYAGSFNTVSIAAGVGYGRNSRVDGVVAPPLGFDPTFLGLSAGIKESSSGLFLQGTWAKRTDTNVATPGLEPVNWYVAGGWAKNVSGAGDTTLFASYDKSTGVAGRNSLNEDSAAHTFTLGLDQAITAANSHIYVTYENTAIDTAVSGPLVPGCAVGPDVTQSMSAITAGMTIGF
jgi:hypothetical protein